MDAHTDGARTSELFPGVMYDMIAMALVSDRPDKSGTKRVRLTQTECSLLDLFLEEPDMVRTREDIAAHCCEPGAAPVAACCLVFRLRNKICAADPFIPREASVVLVRREGYKLGATAH